RNSPRPSSIRSRRARSSSTWWRRSLWVLRPGACSRDRSWMSPRRRNRRLRARRPSATGSRAAGNRQDCDGLHVPNGDDRRLPARSDCRWPAAHRLSCRRRSAMTNAIDVHGLVKRFGDKTVVDHVSMQVAAGEIVGFLGPNGSGKTTTIRMMCGLLTPDEGSGQVLGYDLQTESLKIKREVGYMTQRFSFYEDLTISE